VKFLVRHFEGSLWLLAVVCPILAAMTNQRAWLLPLALIWLLAICVVVPLPFWRAWRRLATVGNKTQYAAWVGFETVCVVGLIVVVVYSAVSR